MLRGMARLSPRLRHGFLFAVYAFVINVFFAALTGHTLGVDKPRVQSSAD